MVVAADHVGDAHVVIVDHHRQHVGRRAVGAQQDQVVELGVLDRDLALDRSSITVSPSRGALRRMTKGAVRPAPRLHVAPRAVDAERPALPGGALALLGELFLGHVAAIGGAAAEQLVGDLGVPRPELRLVIFVAVPIEAEPAQPVEDRVDRRLGRARLVGVLDPQQVLAAVVAGEQPVEQRGARAADMQEAGGRGREAGDDGGRGLISLALMRAFLFCSCCNAMDERP